MISLLDFYKIKKSQKELEFVVPFLDTDRKFFIDPSLLKFSPNVFFQSWYARIDEYLKILNKYIVSGDKNKILELINIGEAGDIALGHCKVAGSSGTGIGREISIRTIDLMLKNEAFKKKGIERLEEIQWLDTNIGPDRVSDLAGNILKSEIIKFTKKIAKKYAIPVRQVRVNKIFDFKNETWITEVHVLPINEKKIVRDVMNPHPPVLVLPTESVKLLPLFLDYDHYYGFVDPTHKSQGGREQKEKVCAKTFENPHFSTEFIKKREKNSDKLYRQDFTSQGIELYEKLDRMPTGHEHANDYRDLVADILSFIFDEDLKMPDKESETFYRENRRDIIYVNGAINAPFTRFLSKYAATNIVVDAKNTSEVQSKDVAQVSNYLNKGTGMVAFIVSRKEQKNIVAHQVAQIKNHEKIILHIVDEDLKRWLRDKVRIQQVTGLEKNIFDPHNTLLKKFKDIETS